MNDIANAETTMLARRYRDVRAHTERLAAFLSAEDQCVQSMPDASPAKWHRAHTTWFFEQFLLKPFAKGYQSFDERFAFLFNSYYVAAGPRHARPERGLITRPNAEPCKMSSLVFANTPPWSRQARHWRPMQSGISSLRKR